MIRWRPLVGAVLVILGTGLLWFIFWLAVYEWRVWV